MSWNFSAIGKPAAIVAALEKHGENLQDQSKLEFEAAKPHLIGLVEQNFDKAKDEQQLIDVEASGYGTAVGGEQTFRQCSVTIKPLYRTLAI